MSATRILYICLAVIIVAVVIVLGVISFTGRESSVDIVNSLNPLPDPHGGFAATSSLCMCPVPQVRVTVNWTKSQMDDATARVRVLKNFSTEVGRFDCSIRKGDSECRGSISAVGITSDPQAQLNVELISAQQPDELLYLDAGTHMALTACDAALCR